MSAGTVELTVVTARWPEVRPGADLVDLLVTHGPEPAEGDIVAFTSKIVSKAEGRYSTAGHDAAVASESVRVVSRRGPLVISESRTGHVQANAGVDGSNVEPPAVLLLPTDADRTARALRAEIARRAAVNVAVVITDTMGRPWRTGHVDQAIGCAGMAPVLDLTGRSDGYGNTLQVTAPAKGDEVAGAADLVKGKLAGTPVAVLRGLAGLVLPPGQDGPGARALVRPAAEDLFGWGAREAVLAAALRVPADLTHFGVPDPADTGRALAAVAGSLEGVRVDLAPGEVDVRATDRSGAFEAGRAVERVVAVLSAHRAEVSVRAVTDTCWHVTYTVTAAIR
jgi:coenzyme F420-0:L-glutamate ligase / coenzyme F420-1:gamma-L-glutamate ligase